MSDISINIEWWELVLLSPIFGWPGLILGAVLGWRLWPKRPIAGAVIGAIVGNAAVFTARVLTM